MLKNDFYPRFNNSTGKYKLEKKNYNFLSEINTTTA